MSPTRNAGKSQKSRENLSGKTPPDTNFVHRFCSHFFHANLVNWFGHRRAYRLVLDTYLRGVGRGPGVQQVGVDSMFGLGGHFQIPYSEHSEYIEVRGLDPVSPFKMGQNGGKREGNGGGGVCAPVNRGPKNFEGAAGAQASYS